MHITEAHISRILKKCYILQMSQKDIARSENLSTATVSRIINKAIDEGYVTFKLNLPSSNYLELEEKIKTRFNLDYVGVARADIDDQEIIDQDVGKMAADYLNETVRPGNIIGISWGRSMSEMVRQLTPKSVADITVVELNGGVSIGAIDNGAVAVVNRLAKNYDGRGVLLPVPSFVDNEKIARTLMSDTQIKEVFELIRNIDMAVFSVGSIRPDSILIKSGYFTGEEYEKLHIKGYVGDICSRYFKADGTHPDEHLYNRVIGITLEELKKVRKKICVAMNRDKAPTIYSAVKSGYISHLFIDEYTARNLLNITGI